MTAIRRANLVIRANQFSNNLIQRVTVKCQIQKSKQDEQKLFWL